MPCLPSRLSHLHIVTRECTFHTGKYLKESGAVRRDDTENVAELELLRAQRAQLASRLKTPW